MGLSGRPGWGEADTRSGSGLGREGAALGPVAGLLSPCGSPYDLVSTQEARYNRRSTGPCMHTQRSYMPRESWDG